MFSEHVYVNRNIVYWYKIYSLYGSKNLYQRLQSMNMLGLSFIEWNFDISG